jgi:hypothetical protein
MMMCVPSRPCGGGRLHDRDEGLVAGRKIGRGSELEVVGSVIESGSSDVVVDMVLAHVICS